MKMGIDTKTLLPFAKCSDRAYQRVCVAHDDNAELILLCWDKGQGTPIHNHGRQECWVHIVEGEMTEKSHPTITRRVAFYYQGKVRTTR